MDNRIDFVRVFLPAGSRIRSSLLNNWPIFALRHTANMKIEAKNWITVIRLKEEMQLIDSWAINMMANFHFDFI